MSGAVVFRAEMLHYAHYDSSTKQWSILERATFRSRSGCGTSGSGSARARRQATAAQPDARLVWPSGRRVERPRAVVLERDRRQLGERAPGAELRDPAGDCKAGAPAAVLLR